MSRTFVRPYTVAVLIAGILAAACSGPDPAKSLAAAKSHLAKNDTAAAVIELKNALQAKPDLAEARLLLGRALLEREDAVGAVVELQKAADLRVPADDVVPPLARALLQSGQARKVVELDQANTLTTPQAIAELKTSTAMAQAVLGALDRAQVALDAALRAKPDHAPAVLMQARNLAGRGDLDAASKATDGVLAKNPADTDALKFKADLLFSQGRDDDAQAALRKVLEIDPRHVAAHVALIERALQKGDMAGAEAQHAALKKARPRAFQTALLDARISAQKGDLNAAHEKIQELLKLAPDDRQALLLAGLVALNRDDLLLAEQHLAKLVQAAPGGRPGRLLLARVYMRSGEPDKAMALLQPLLEAQPPVAEALSMAGSASLMAGDTKAAEEYLSRAVKANPANAGTRTALVVAGMVRGDVEGGLLALEKLAGTDAGVTADTALISSLVNRRNWDAALKAIDRLEQKQPGRPGPHQVRGRVLLAKGDRAAARAAFEKALVANPKFFPAVGALAALDVQERKIPAARARLDAVLKADPRNARAMVILGELDLQEGKPADVAGAHFAEAVKAAPADPAVRRRYIQFLVAKPDVKAALAAAQDASAALPNDLDLLGLLAATQVTAGELNQGIATYNKLVAARPKALPPLLGLAEAHMAAKSVSGADEAVARALALAPDSLQVVRMAVKADLVANRTDKALQRARAVQQKLPKASAGWILEGDVAVVAKNWKEAADAYRTALKREPGTQIAQRVHGALRMGGQRAESDAFAADWVKSNPKDTMFLFHVSSISLADQTYDKAIRELEQILQVAPDSAAALNNLAWARVKQGQPGAVDAARRANELSPNVPAFMDTLALALGAEGKVAEAVELQRKVVVADPNAPSYRLGLARLLLQAGDKAAARKELEGLASAENPAVQKEVKELQSKL